MPTPLAQLPAVAQATIEVARAQFEKASNSPASGGYRLLYVAFPGCGSQHDYTNLIRADNLPGVTLQYVSVFSPGVPFTEKNRITGKIETAPGISLSAPGNTQGERYNAASQFLRSKGLELYDVSHAVLMRADGTVIKEFDSTKGPGFLSEVTRLTQSARPLARSL
ncbi:MAG: hypothetical protein ACKVOE_09450 [Rickettsiales bacterium]